LEGSCHLEEQETHESDGVRTN